ncbi:tumor protein p53-inducible protein 11-like isoform X2 [Salvelinus alpinus]|uniref:tumor protein p53-inducible protein 11-like isoform X2 n=1 Tax=Salvelinus alpinus TaxID=8036 RepID=UPI0039FC3B1A
MASKPHPPLMKKHSQSDLVSRLKTRKILGVGGEDDDGEVHRSKALVCPNQLYEVVFEEEINKTSISIRLYGGALLSLSLILWNGVYAQEKVIIQWTLLSEACYFAVQFIVTSVTLLEMGSFPNAAILLLLSRVLFLLVTLFYYYHLGRGRPKKI